ncbi:Uncharacterised protein [Mycobacteroides abscessus subsp. abscessus]|nr:Uncharacterised protein [Mycobacteroides abscessus subsp. abscessus]
MPSSATSAYRLSRLARGTRTLSNTMRPLSTPASPPLYPQSLVVMPGRSLPWASRIGTTKQCTPRPVASSPGPPVTSWAKTADTVACSAAPPM